mgnify:CR=1 FL=1
MELGASLRSLLCALATCLLPFAAAAHQTSDSFLLLEIEGARVTGQWHLALHDLEFAVGLDADEDLAITWGEVKARRAGGGTDPPPHPRRAPGGGAGGARGRGAPAGRPAPRSPRTI